MMLSRKLLNPLLITVTAALLVACTNNTRITRSYVDPELKQSKHEGVLVVAVAQRVPAKNGFENAFADALTRHGLHAVAAHTLLKQGKPTAEDVLAAAEAAGLETIMVTRYIGETSEEIYHPGTIYYGVAPAYGVGYYGGFPGYYGHAYEVAYQQPVWTTNTTHTMVSDLYETKSHGHMWQAVTDTIQSGSASHVRTNVINALMADLKKQGLL